MVIKMNFITLQDANMPLLVNEFLEEFAKCQYASLIDFFFKYNQLTLNVKSKDIIAFITPLSLLKITTLLQGATNLVAQFIQVVITILKDLFLAIAMLFIDNIRVKGLYTDYSRELKLLGIRRFVFEHLQNLNKALNRIKQAKASIRPKSQFCYDSIGIIGFVCGFRGRSLAATKVSKILDQHQCNNITKAKAFLGICVYYRIQIEAYAIIAKLIHRLLKKGEPFL